MSSYGANYTHTQIKNDISEMVKADLSDNAVYAILHDIAWAWTEQEQVNNSTTKTAKLKGCTYWTKEAFEMAFDQQNLCPQKGFNFNKNLRHEHIVPKIIFKESVRVYLKNNSLTSQTALQNLYKAMEDKLIGCVVTANQAKKLDAKYAITMPSGHKDFLSIKDPWERYKESKKIYPSEFSLIYQVDWEQQGNRWVVDKYNPTNII